MRKKEITSLHVVDDFSALSIYTPCTFTNILNKIKEESQCVSCKIRDTTWKNIITINVYFYIFSLSCIIFFYLFFYAV